MKPRRKFTAPDLYTLMLGLLFLAIFMFVIGLVLSHWSQP